MRTKLLAITFALPMSLALAGGAFFVASSPALAAADGDCGGSPNSHCGDNGWDDRPTTKSTTTTEKNGAGNLRQFDATGDSMRITSGNFISAHEQCRWVNNTSGVAALFIPLKRASEWASFYNTNAGGNAQIAVCCKPVDRAICGDTVRLNFMVVGDTTTLEAGYTKKIVYRCAANNNVAKHSESGACEGPSGGSGTDHDHEGHAGSSAGGPGGDVGNSY